MAYLVLLLKELLNHHSDQFTVIQVYLANTQTGVQSYTLEREETQVVAYFSLSMHR